MEFAALPAGYNAAMFGGAIRPSVSERDLSSLDVVRPKAERVG
jgi:hypothetical protein